MKITEYKTIIQEETMLTILVKESEFEYNWELLNNPESIYKMMEDIFHMSCQAEEYLYLLCLNTKNRPLGLFEVFHGTVNMSFINAREIFIRALLCGSTNIVLLHNHPSQDTTPSKVDIESTEKLLKASNLIGISLLDHIIVGNGYYSLKQHGLM